MKKLVITLLLLMGLTLKAQVVQVQDQNGKVLIVEASKKDVPDLLIKHPDGKYLIIELKATKVDGMLVFKKCWYKVERKKLKIFKA